MLPIASAVPDGEIGTLRTAVDIESSVLEASSAVASPCDEATASVVPAASNVPPEKIRPAIATEATPTVNQRIEYRVTLRLVYF